MCYHLLANRNKWKGIIDIHVRSPLLTFYPNKRCPLSSKYAICNMDLLFEDYSDCLLYIGN